MAAIFKSENEMQQWLSGKLRDDDNCLVELITNREEIEQAVSDSMLFNKVVRSFKHCLQSLNQVSIISENENISLKDGDILKPDFLLYAPETESLVIVELKNILTASRQVGTEVSAYANEVKSYVPFISDGDIINVIVSSSYSTLVNHYVFHEIFWMHRNIICLEPYEENAEVFLKILDPQRLIDENFSLKLCERHLGGYQICLYDHGLYTDKADRKRLDQYIEQMKTAISSMAVTGNAQRNHGFAFLWRDMWIDSLAPYSITVVNFAPFQSVERFFHDESFVPNEITKAFIDIIKNYDPGGQGQSLSEISDSGTKFLSNFCEPQYEGYHDWEVLRQIMHGRADYISFHAWGIFSELHADRIFKEYERGNINISSSNPQLGLALIDELIDPTYKFIDISWYESANAEDEEDDEWFNSFEDNNQLRDESGKGEGTNNYDDLPF